MQIVIVGGGLVGASAAVAAVRAGHQVTLLERGAAPDAGAASDDWDLRISSVHQTNVAWLEELGVWAQVEPTKFLSYDGLSVTTRDRQTLNFSAQEVAAERLGVMVENDALVRACWQVLRTHDSATLLPETEVKGYGLAQRAITLSDGQTLNYDLLIGADGANSAVAKAAGIGVRGWDYGMRCLLAIAEVEQPLPAATWEVFRAEGPYALLPLGEHLACLIDYRTEEEWRNAATAEVEQKLQATFTDVIGPYKLQKHASFPLRRQRALRYFDPCGVALIGDAAHSIHPLAGQGVNLGFTDVQVLFEQLAKEPLTTALANYERQQVKVNQQMMRAMDAIHWGFRSEHFLPRAAVALGLIAVGQMKPLKQHIIKAAMGWK
ncbi:UbiH/Coq6 family FAD-binding oxidoreductase [Pseudidiomarina aquimaris]|uniref:UbiH/Coq6 family FAD-binding oxidoreductase n=1 Tax=Pseudidiomarina aquimaris TaxID=641841 RepID=A0A432XGK0_9GAMM|nr:FAD-dependent oxidoreductase [Pseudidiomarina aquimaris]RUO47800.1 UbiH/Coq6 family FAD-binding oxidoreductase [Pseudidiomarina aquimaris]